MPNYGLLHGVNFRIINFSSSFLLWRTNITDAEQRKGNFIYKVLMSHTGHSFRQPEMLRGNPYKAKIVKDNGPKYPQTALDPLSVCPSACVYVFFERHLLGSFVCHAKILKGYFVDLLCSTEQWPLEEKSIVR